MQEANTIATLESRINTVSRHMEFLDKDRAESETILERLIAFIKEERRKLVQ